MNTPAGHGNNLKPGGPPDIELDEPSFPRSETPSGEAANSETRPASIGLKSVLITILGLLLIWVPAILLLQRLPSEYVAAWTILIPGSNVGTSIDLESTGQANTSIASQYSTAGIDPKVNYKAIALSLPVRKRAAMILDVPIEDLEKPKVKLTQQTSLMQLLFTAGDAEGVKELADVYYTAFIEQLEALRNELQIIKEKESTRIVNEHRATVKKTSKALADFRDKNTIVSVKQHDSLLADLVEMNTFLSRTEIEKSSVDAKLSSIETTLDIDTESAGQMLKLEHDTLFQALMESYADSHIAYLSETAVLGRKHPKVVAARSQSLRHLSDLSERASLLLGSPEVLDELLTLPGSNEVISSILKDYLQLASEENGLESQIDKIRNAIDKQNSTLQSFTRLRTTLEYLEREQEVATTVYASALARVDLENIDRFAVYPITQLLSPPEKPAAEETLKSLLLLAASAAGTLLILLAAILYWTRYKWLPAIRKK